MSVLNKDEERDIRLWFGWGAIYDYPTGPRAYLKAALAPHRKAEFLSIPRPKRKAILRFVIDETERRTHTTTQR